MGKWNDTFVSHGHGHTNSDMKNIDNNNNNNNNKKLRTRAMIIAILNQQIPKTKQTSDFSLPLEFPT